MNAFSLWSIRTQIFFLATILVVLVSIIATAAEPYIYGRHERGFAMGMLAGRIQGIVDRLSEDRTPTEEQNDLKYASDVGVKVTKVSPPMLNGSNRSDWAPEDAWRRVRGAKEDDTLRSIFHSFTRSSTPEPVYVRIDDHRAYVFSMPDFPDYVWFYPAVISGILKIVIPLALLAYCSSWLITGPLERFAASAERASADDQLREPFAVTGASEVRSLATSLNIMRARVMKMVEDRTNMLSAISHDLKTPLTRLRMRVERCHQPELQQQMLADIGSLDLMIGESLAFLTNVSHRVPVKKVDISSLLQTIANDFADTGVHVRFEGPRRMTYVCKPQSINRAVTNLVGNASRYAANIALELKQADSGGIVIRVSDDGPGIPDELKDRVLEPFVKGDAARTSGNAAGFGLGLPIAEGIIRVGHGGSLVLYDNQPHGLIVEIRLPPASSRDLGGERTTATATGIMD